MQLLKKGSQGVLVKELQEILRELDYDLPVTSLFDEATYKAVRNFQGSHLDIHGVPLEIDGKVGDISWWALHNPRVVVTGGVVDYTRMPNASFGGSATGRKALEFAIKELKAGAGEVGGNNKGPFVKKYLAPTGLSEGNAWCAAFLSWCFLQAASGNLNNMPFKYAAGARNVFTQLRNKGLDIKSTNINYTPEPGDIVTWWRVSMSSGFGHIAIVHHSEDGFIYTIEGNKAANVAGFNYVKTSMDKVLGFARV